MAHRVMARVNSLTLGGSGEKTLSAMEAHGKRFDKSSRARRTSRRRPIVHGTLDLRAAYDRHVDGARMNAGLNRPVLHMLMKFPDACLTNGPDTPAPYRGLTERQRKQLMMDQAVAFANRCYGGNAVFAGRVDRDEAGELNVDIFMSPRYVKRTKTGKESEWISTTKHGKELVERHRAAIIKRMPKARDLNSPRAVGIAIQEELAAFHREVNGIQTVREPKIGRRPDRRAIEDWQASQDAARTANDAAVSASLAEAQAADAVARLEEAEAKAQAAEAKARAAEQRAMESEKRRVDADAARAQGLQRSAAVADALQSLSAEVSARTLVRNAQGKLVSANRAPILAGYPEVGPAVAAAGRLVDALATAEREMAAERDAVQVRQDAMTQRAADLDQRARSLDRREKDLDKERVELGWARQVLDRVIGWIARRQGIPSVPLGLRDALGVIEEAARPRMRVAPVEATVQDAPTTRMRIVSGTPQEPLQPVEEPEADSNRLLTP